MTALVIALFLSLNQPKFIGIMGAMDIELEFIKQEMSVERTDTIADRIFTRGELSGLPCICVKVGVGKVNAALTADLLIREFNVDAIIFTGVAGGVNPQLNIGDIVISKRVLYHDFGQIASDTFLPWDTLGFSADSFLIDITVQAAGILTFEPVPVKICKETGHLPDVIVGNIVTGDQFISSESKRRWLEETFRAECVEMEGAAVAQVCRIHNVPFVIIRSLSDLANEKADIDFELFVAYAARNSSLIVGEIFKLLNK